MNEQTRNRALDLIRCAKNMREAANNLWWAHNPDEEFPYDTGPLSVEDAQEAHGDAFSALQRAEYYMQKELDSSAAETSVQRVAPKADETAHHPMTCSCNRCMLG